MTLDECLDEGRPSSDGQPGCNPVLPGPVDSTPDSRGGSVSNTGCLCSTRRQQRQEPVGASLSVSRFVISCRPPWQVRMDDEGVHFPRASFVSVQSASANSSSAPGENMPYMRKRTASLLGLAVATGLAAAPSCAQDYSFLGKWPTSHTFADGKDIGASEL